MLQSRLYHWALPAARSGTRSRSNVIEADLLASTSHQGGQRLRRPVRRLVPGRDRGSARGFNIRCTLGDRDDGASSGFARRFDLDLGRDWCPCPDWLRRRLCPLCTASASPYRLGDACSGGYGPRHRHSAAAGVAGQRVGVKDCRPTRRRVRPKFLSCLSAPPNIPPRLAPRAVLYASPRDFLRPRDDFLFSTDLDTRTTRRTRHMHLAQLEPLIMSLRVPCTRMPRFRISPSPLRPLCRPFAQVSARFADEPA